MFKSKEKTVQKELSDIFLITTRWGKEQERGKVYVEDGRSDKISKLNYDNLPHLLHKRLLMTDEELKSNSLADFREAAATSKLSTHETRILPYLFNCYRRARKFSQSSQRCIGIIVDITHRYLKSGLSGIDRSERPGLKIMALIPEADDLVYDFLRECMKNNLSDNSDWLISLLQPLRIKIYQELKLLTRNLHFTDQMKLNYKKYTKLLQIYTITPQLCMNFLEWNSTFPAVTNSRLPNIFESNILGVVLSWTCLPRTGVNLFDFESTSKQDAVFERQTEIAQEMSNMTVERVYDLFMSIIKCGDDCKTALFQWIYQLLDSNQERTNQTGETFLGDHPESVCPHHYVTDGFMANLTMVLLKMSAPAFLPGSEKLMSIQPTFCLSESTGQGWGSFVSIEKDELANIVHPDSYNFRTKLFYRTQHAISLFIHSVKPRYFATKNRMELMEDQIKNNKVDMDAKSLFGEEYFTIVSRFHSYKSMICDKNLTSTIFKFAAGTALYLTNLGLYGEMKSLSSGLFILPLKLLFGKVKLALQCQPVAMVDNVCSVLFLSDQNRAEFLKEVKCHSYFLDFVLLFMSNRERLERQHFRTRLAETLNRLITCPSNEPKQPAIVSRGEDLMRISLLVQYRSTNLIPLALFITYNDAENSDEQVHQKFFARSNVYTVLTALCINEYHRQVIKNLAEVSMMRNWCEDAPTFLRFVFLLVEEARWIFDELETALNNLSEAKSQLKKTERRTLAQEQELNDTLQDSKARASMHQYYTLRSVFILSHYTSEYPRFYSQQVISTNLIKFLKSLLTKLTGDVSLMTEYNFQPDLLLLFTCKIYSNLKFEPEFCLAVASEESSNLSKLFDQANSTLNNSKFYVNGEFKIFARAIGEKFTEQAQIEEKFRAESPDEYLDPITCELMRDPVMMPISKQIVDKTFICQHLLRDSTDPFNRTPLTPNQLIPQPELKYKIDNWVRQQRYQHTSSADK